MMDLNELADRMYPATAKAQPSEAKTAPQPQAAPAMQPQAAPEPQPEADSETKPFMAQRSLPQPHADTTYELTLPDDAVIEAKAIERTMAFAKDAGLSPAAAQRALEHANSEVSAYQAQVTNDWNVLTRETWVTETRNDPEIGGEKYHGAVADAKRFLEKFGDPEVLEFLDRTGFGNNKMVVRLLARAEKGITNERRATRGTSGGVDVKKLASRMFHTP